VTEGPAPDQPIVCGATITDLLAYEQRIIDMQEAVRWKSINDKLLDRLGRLRPCPWGSVTGAL
jgi:hypothetical protein